MGKSKSILKPIPVWKKWLSYIFDVHLERTGSDHNEELNLCLNQGRLQLYTENAIYSFEDLYDNFFEVFKRIDFGKHTFPKILILGFGLGSIPFMLEKKFGVKAHYTGVEIDEEILRMASQYALPKLDSPYTLFSTDAHLFAASNDDHFNMIVVDVFLDNIIPNKFEKTFFLENIKEMLLPDGLILYNRLTATAGDKERHEIFFEQTFNPIFSQATGISVEDNTILLSTPIHLKSNR